MADEIQDHGIGFELDGPRSGSLPPVDESLSRWQYRDADGHWWYFGDPGAPRPHGMSLSFTDSAPGAEADEDP